MTHPALPPPILQDDWGATVDPGSRLFDITDGWGWRAIQAGLHRRQGGTWEVEDVMFDPVDQRFIGLPNGLMLQFNLDW